MCTPAAPVGMQKWNLMSGVELHSARLPKCLFNVDRAGAPPTPLGPKAKVEATTQEPQARTLLGVLFSRLGQLYYVARLARPPRVQFSHWASTFRWQFLQQKVGSDDFNGSGANHLWFA